MSYIVIGFINENISSSENDLSGDGTNSPAWDAFGDILDEALVSYPGILNSIKSDEWIYQNVYSFIALSNNDFNTSIRAINGWIYLLRNPTEWQKWGVKVWADIVEPLMIRDHRYVK